MSWPKTQQPPPDRSTHWSTRKLGRVLKIHYSLVAKTWQRAGLQPHRFERYMQSDDPDFESQAADFAALDTQSGDVLGQTLPRHTSAAVCRIPRRHRCQSAEAANDSRHRGQAMAC